MANDGSRRALHGGGRDRSGLFCAIMLLVSLFATLLNSCDAQNSSIRTDAEGLLAFIAGADPGGSLTPSWSVGSNPCGNRTIGLKPWAGVQCNSRGRVNFLTLNNLGLSGTFTKNSLSGLDQLRYLSLTNNSFTGPFPDDLPSLSGLLQLWAQNANFSGQLPELFTPARRPNLLVVNLYGNNLTGSIPNMTGVTALSVLNLSNNLFTGSIPPLPSRLTTLDLSSNFLSGNIPSVFPPSLANLSLVHNQFTGEIPSSLAQKFPNASFEGNVGLCGPPLSTPCPSPGPAPSPAGVVSNSSVAPASEPGDAVPPPIATPSAPVTGASHHHSGISLSTKTIIIIVVADAGVLLLIALGFLLYFRRRYATEVHEKQGPKGSEKKKKSADRAAGFSDGTDSSKLVFVDDDSLEKFDLDFLLRSSAEMLGKGSFGTAYRAVLESGAIVAVKRLRDVKEMKKEDFERQMKMLGRLKHPNVVPLKAYYYTKEENLLVYEFMAGGSLFSRLHGNGGDGRKPLGWDSRLRIAQDVAVGLTYLHHECQQIPHGNLKASNIILGKDCEEVCIADFGLVPLMTSAVASQRMAGYRAPEVDHKSIISQKADVYSFGVLLLELLTGRQPAQSFQGEGIDLPKWVQSMVREEWTGEVFDPELKDSAQGEDEMVALLQIAMACLTANPDQRPGMAQVLKNIEDIRVEDSSFLDSQSIASEESDSGGVGPPISDI